MTDERRAGLGARHDGAPMRLLWAVWWPLGLVWAVLLALVCGSVLVAYLPLGIWTFPLLVAIALIQSGLVAWFFMQVNRASALNRLTSATAFVFIAVMFAFTLADLFNRF